jgi:membrane associated rhomboid family serine protease
MLPIKDRNPTERLAFFTLLLVFANIGVFLYQLSLANLLENFIKTFGFIPAHFFGSLLKGNFAKEVFLPLFTSLFLHGNLIHLGGNMLYLWIFGNNVEDTLGHFPFLLFYLFCGIVANLAQGIINPASTIPAIGASGAISGILAAYLVFFPEARIVTLIPLFFFWEIVELPALVVIGLWFLLQAANSFYFLTSGESGGVAWFAHLGGFLAGLIIALILKKRVKKRRSFYSDYYY